MLEEPESKFNIKYVFDTEPKPEEKPTQETTDDQSSLDTLDIHMIRVTPLIRLTKKPKHMIFAITMADIKKALAPKKYTNPVIKIPVKHHKYLDVFS